LKMTGGYVQNGFSIKTGQTLLFGIVENGIVTQLCLGNNSSNHSDELQRIVSELGLLFVDWCNCQILTPND
jgi:hypothetical protein